MRIAIAVAAAVSLAGAAAGVLGAQGDRVTDGPGYAPDGALVRPADYRGWVYLSSGLNMTYGADAPNPARNQPFNNVFVNRQAYARFMDSGRWPEETMFVLEIRRSQQHVRPDNFGYTQAALTGMEAAVKDTARNGPIAWAYYSFDGPDGLTATARPLPERAGCQKCHAENTAVEQTFVQFYPTLLEVARARGTVKPAYNPRAEITGH